MGRERVVYKYTNQAYTLPPAANECPTSLRRLTSSSRSTCLSCSPQPLKDTKQAKRQLRRREVGEHFEDEERTYFPLPVMPWLVVRGFMPLASRHSSLREFRGPEVEIFLGSVDSADREGGRAGRG